RAADRVSANSTNLWETFNPLSDREEQVVRLVCEGLTNRQIAERLGVSKRTIEFFRANAMRKLGAHNAKELQHRFQLKY
uniref:LuxR C-terminal-related transcriptional regulator n=1 Tax=uncultured Sutterella sp. TaxID=286133 RepID=UPI0026DDB0FF